VTFGLLLFCGRSANAQAPTGTPAVTLSQGDTSVTLNWTPVAGALWYDVFKSEDGGAFVREYNNAQTLTLTFNPPHFSNGHSYRFYVVGPITSAATALNPTPSRRPSRWTSRACAASRRRTASSR
jgi:hypothetical protein